MTTPSYAYALSHDANTETETAHAADTAQTRAGRPRSEASRRAILDSTRRLMAHTPLRDLSIEAIARKAGVGKTTIYRWWPNKVAVVIEAFSDQLDLQGTEGNTDHLPPADAMERQIEKMVRHLRGRNGRILSDIIAEAQADEGVLALFQAFYLNTRRDALVQIFYRGQQAGQFRTSIHPTMVADMVMGPVFFRLLTNRDGLDDGFIEQYPSTILDQLRTGA